MKKIIEGLNNLFLNNIQSLNIDNIYTLPLEFLLSFENINNSIILNIESIGISKSDFFVGKREKRLVNVNLFLISFNYSGLNNNYYLSLLEIIDKIIELLRENIQYTNYWTRISDISVEKIDLKYNNNMFGFKISINFERTL